MITRNYHKSYVLLWKYKVLEISSNKHEEINMKLVLQLRIKNKKKKKSSNYSLAPNNKEMRERFKCELISYAFAFQIIKWKSTVICFDFREMYAICYFFFS